jgi:hypothetical protein
MLKFFETRLKCKSGGQINIEAKESKAKKVKIIVKKLETGKKGQKL